MYTLLTTILKRYKLFPTNILALGDEEVGWLGERDSSHQLWSLMSSREQVDQAKKSLPALKAYAQKFESYRITGIMQLTYALHQQLNQLDTKKRSKVMETIAKHTSPYGLMVIDIALPAYYEAQSKSASSVQISDEQVVLSSWSQKRHQYIYNQVKFVQTQTNTEVYRKTQENEQYYTTTLADIKKLAGQYRETVTVLDIKGRKLTKAADHILLVCQKWWPDWKAKK